MENRDMNELCDLWNKLGDTPTNEDGDLLDEDFLHFKSGHEVMDVWHWFEEQNPAFIVGEAGGHIGADHPFRAEPKKDKSRHVYDEISPN